MPKTKNTERREREEPVLNVAGFEYLRPNVQKNYTLGKPCFRKYANHHSDDTSAGKVINFADFFNNSAVPSHVRVRYVRTKDRLKAYAYIATNSCYPYNDDEGYLTFPPDVVRVYVGVAVYFDDKKKHGGQYNKAIKGKVRETAIMRLFYNPDVIDIETEGVMASFDRKRRRDPVSTSMAIYEAILFEMIEKKVCQMRHEKNVREGLERVKTV